MVAINTKKLVLQDNWPGTPNFNLGKPKGGFDATTWTDATTKGYPLGTKIQVHQDFSGVTGPYTMIYLKFHCMSGHNAIEKVDLSAAGQAIVQAYCSSECISADGTSNAFTCSNVSPSHGYICGTKNGRIAVACGSMSDRDVTTGLGGTEAGAYGWFWCGGVCPMDITILSGAADAGVDMSTGGNVAIGEPIYCQVDTSVVEFDGASDLSANVCGLALATDA